MSGAWLRDKDRRLIEPDFILPEKRRNRFADVYLELWYTAFQQALLDLEYWRGRKPSWDVRRIVLTAVAWFDSESEAVCSFRWLCAQLGLSASKIRHALASRIDEAEEAVEPRRKRARLCPLAGPRIEAARRQG